MDKEMMVAILCFIAAMACNPPSAPRYDAADERLTYQGRRDHTRDGVVLISSAASVSMHIMSSRCTLLLRNLTPYDGHNYFTVEVDRQHMERVRIEGNAQIKHVVDLPAGSTHHVSVSKTTEPSVGNLLFEGVICDRLNAAVLKTRPRIEFIGNSITCAMSANMDEIPCDQGVWYDQHDAYCSYASQVARKVDAEYMLSSSSGCGIYRHWNRDTPNIPGIYDQTYLDDDTTRRWDFTQWTPDLVTICLGTNDVSPGDGVTPRMPFDSAYFTSEYIRFAERLFGYYPETTILLLTSPMVQGEMGDVLEDCLRRVDASFPEEKVDIFSFTPFIPKGCGYHPSCEEQSNMANELVPVVQRLLN